MKDIKETFQTGHVHITEMQGNQQEDKKKKKKAHIKTR